MKVFVFILAASLAPCAWCAAQDADVQQLVAQKNQTVQKQIAKVYASLHQPGGIDTGNNVEAFQELQKLKDVADEGELVKQLAVFAVSPGDEQQPLATYVILGWLRIPSHITIDVLAPYLDTKDDRLRAFVLDFFHGLDRADSGPFVGANYYDYMEYIRGKANRGEEMPAPFIKYIYERSPGQALRVFLVATVDVSDYMRILNRSVEAAQQGKTPTQQERAEIRRIQAKRQQEGQKRREIVLAEHIISNALWLKKHGFDERFHEVLPEAVEEVKKLAKSEHWWVRLYVVYIMRKNHVLLQDHIRRQLAEDESELVREAATAGRGQ